MKNKIEFVIPTNGRDLQLGFKVEICSELAAMDGVPRLYPALRAQLFITLVPYRWFKLTT